MHPVPKCNAISGVADVASHVIDMVLPEKFQYIKQGAFCLAFSHIVDDAVGSMGGIDGVFDSQAQSIVVPVFVN